jgi:dihydroxynaphthoic acid synthetase
MSGGRARVQYDATEHVAHVRLDRPEVLNAMDLRMHEELCAIWDEVERDDDVRVVVLTGAGDRAFSSGGDTKQRAETGDYGPTDIGFLEMAQLQRILRDIPKPVIAAVNGLAIGAGHVLHVICDLTIAADHARFGQAGPRVGSFDAGFGAAYLARVVGEKRAREIWFLCRQYDAVEAERWGLVNRIVPKDELVAETKKWAAEISALSPTALMFLKHAFNTDTEHQAAIFKMSEAGLHLFTHTEEGQEGARAFAEKRKPDFSGYSVV